MPLPSIVMPRPTWVQFVTLLGTRVRLEPLAEHHLPDLIEANTDPAIWHWVTGTPLDAAGLQRWLTSALTSQTAGEEVPFATIDCGSGRAIGSTRFMAIAPEHRRLEIGWTWVGPSFHRTGANREAKLLQLTHAFETLHAERVEFKTHARNERSRAALLGIGATFERILRHHMRLADGSTRDSAYYSVIAPDWPDVKAQLVASLDRGSSLGR
jgi:RimJ/RimL family protein N-acetyltransferase